MSHRVLTRRRAAGVRVAAILVLVVMLSVSLAGCGGSSSNGVASKSAAEILSASEAAATSAASVHVVSKSSNGPVAVALNLRLASDGGRAQVSLLGLAFEAVRVDGMLYLKGNPTFDRRLAANTGVHIPRGRWLKAPAGSSRFAELAAYTSPSELRVLLSTTSPVKGATTTIDGQPAIALKEAGKLYTGVLYVATTGKPFPIEFVKHGSEVAQTTFSGWNKPATLSAPTDALADK
jgi:hypothetical protein